MSVTWTKISAALVVLWTWRREIGGTYDPSTYVCILHLFLSSFCCPINMHVCKSHSMPLPLDPLFSRPKKYWHQRTWRKNWKIILTKHIKFWDLGILTGLWALHTIWLSLTVWKSDDFTSQIQLWVLGCW